MHYNVNCNILIYYTKNVYTLQRSFYWNSSINVANVGTILFIIQVQRAIYYTKFRGSLTDRERMTNIKRRVSDRAEGG